MEVTLCDNFVYEMIANQNVDLNDDIYHIALLSGDTIRLSASSYLAGLTNWSEISSEESTGAGYTHQEISTIMDGFSLKGTDVYWIESSVSAYGAVVFRPSDGLLVEFIKFDSLQESIVGTFSIIWDSAGIIRITKT